MVALDLQEPEDATVQELAPIDQGIRAWTFCISGMILETMTWGFSFSYGIFQDYYTSHPPFNTASAVSIAAVGTLCLTLQYGGAFFFSLVMARYPDWMHVFMWSGLAIYFLSFFISSFATEVWQLILLQGVGIGLGSGLLYMPVIKLLPEWFSERRGLAGGIIFSGNGVGGFAFPFILNALLQRVGLRWTLRIFALGTTLCSAIALLGMRSRLPTPKYSATQRRPKFIPPNVKFFRNPFFLTFSLTILAHGLSYFPVSLYIATFTKKLADQLTATVVLALFNLAAMCGQVVVGHMSDRFPYPLIMVVTELGAALGAFLLWGFASTAVYVYLFAIIFGFLNGGFVSTWLRGAADIVVHQPEYAGVAFSGIMSAKGISAVVGPIISGLLLQAGGGLSMGRGYGRFGYGVVEIFVGSCALAAGAGSVVVAFSRAKMLS